MKKALVTLAIGESYFSKWKTFCEPNWKSYAKKYGYELIVLDKYLDTSDRGISRSPAWQKCLILEQPEVKKFDRVVWMDSDIIINDELAPDLISIVPEEKIGGTNAFSFYTEDFYAFLFEIYANYWRSKGINIVSDKTPNSYYTQFGIDTNLTAVIQTGVMVLTSKLHNDILTYVYYNYEDKGNAVWHYEMRPLSYEIVKNNCHFFIDDRFNYLFAYFKLAFYPHLLDYKTTFYQKLLGKIGIGNSLKELQTAISAAYLNSYCLHFAGCSHEMSSFKPRPVRHDEFF